MPDEKPTPPRDPATLCARDGCSDRNDVHAVDGHCYGRMGACVCEAFVEPTTADESLGEPEE